LTIPELGSGETYNTSWLISVSEPGLQPLLAYAGSSEAGFDQAYTSFQALGYADLDVTLAVPTSVTPGAAFDMTATVLNAGDLPATDVQVVIAFSGELGTGDPQTIIVGDLAAGEGHTVVWSLNASSAGVHSVQVNASETSVGSTEQTGQLVIAVQSPHTIQLSASQYAVFGLEPVTLYLTLENQGNVEDSIMLDVVSNNPNIGFTVYKQGTPLNGPVVVPANGEIQLELVVYPQQWENGLITFGSLFQATFDQLLK
jgi:hypothetical protein